MAIHCPPRPLAGVRVWEGAPWGRVRPAGSQMMPTVQACFGTQHIRAATTCMCAAVNVSYLAVPSFEAAQQVRRCSPQQLRRQGCCTLPLCASGMTSPAASVLHCRCCRHQVTALGLAAKRLRLPLRTAATYCEARFHYRQVFKSTYSTQKARFPLPVQVFVAAKRDLGEVLSAFEFLDRESLHITLRHLPGAKDPLPSCQVGGRARCCPVLPCSAFGAVHISGCLHVFDWHGRLNVLACTHAQA